MIFQLSGTVNNYLSFESDKSLITTEHRGIDIPIEGAWDKKNSKLIIFTFSQPKNITEEVSVIKGLIKEFVAPGKADRQSLVDADSICLKPACFK